MNTVRFSLRILTLLTFALAFAVVTQAQATRTWVSGVGDDVNPCSRTAPCKTYAGAISKTAKDGEISTLDPGGFGAVTITKSITINGGGGGQGYGSILSALAPQGVLVNITDPADVRKTVRLDWLNINGASTGTDGIRMIAGNALHVENTLIDGMVGDGIDVNITGANVAELYVNNVSIRNCVGNGIVTNASNAAGLVASSLTGVHIANCGDGFEATLRSVATIRNSTISTNNGAGAAGIRVNGATSDVNVETCSISYNTSGIRVDLGTARVANTMFAGNTTGLQNVGGTLKTYGDNRRDGQADSGVISGATKT
jgi:hypothetical protein